MKSLKTFEPPKNGEMILRVSNRGLYAYVIFCGLISLGISWFLKSTSFVDWLIPIGVFILLGSIPIIFMGNFTLNMILYGGPIKNVFYFDEYIIVDSIYFNNKVTYEFVDNFLYYFDERRIKIVFLIGDIDSDMSYKPKDHFYSQEMIVNKKFKNVSIELVNYLNDKIKSQKRKDLTEEIKW